MKVLFIGSTGIISSASSELALERGRRLRLGGFALSACGAPDASMPGWAGRRCGSSM
jgi:hypothetical protein